MSSEKKIVCIGGGTGLSTMLRGLKKYCDNITAIVTVADNGGHSGIIRKEQNVLPPGDIRNCLLALAETEPMLESLFQHRFKEGSLKGLNLGNLFLVGLSEIFDSFPKAVEKAHDVLRVKGQVLPVTIEDVQLKALYDDGSEVIGESEIVAANKSHKKHIKRMTLIPEAPPVYKNVIKCIDEADIILLGPGSLYTSIVPNLLVEGVCDAIQNASGQVVYISNIMTQPGETDDFSLIDHVDVIEEYIGEGVIDKIVVNNGSTIKEVLDHYMEDGAQLVFPKNGDERVVSEPLLVLDTDTGYLRHNADKLAQTILTKL